MIRHLLPVLLVLPVVPGTAAELAVRDLRLGLVTRPADFDFTVTAPLVEVSGSDAFDGGLSVEGGVRWSFARTGDVFGLVVGSDLALDGQAYGGGDGLITAWARIAAGVGWAASDRLTVLAEALASFGLSAISLPATASAGAYDADGTAIAYEARLTGVWQFTRSFNAGLAAGWLAAEHDLSGDDSDLVIEQGSWYAALVAGWRLSDLPAPLE